jgi:hypothetical protein
MTTHRRTTLATALAVGALALTACGGDDPAARPSPTGGFEEDYPTRAPQPDAAAVREAMTSTDTGRFETTIDLPGTTVRRTGVYRLADGATRNTSTVTTEESELSVESIAVDGLTFARVDDGDQLVMERCWLRYDVAALASAGPVADAVVATVPPEVQALTAVEDDGGAAEATAPLYPVVSAFGAAAVADLGIGPDIGGRAPIGYVIENGSARYSFELGRVLAAVEEQGVDVPDDIRTATRSSRLSGLVTEVGEPVDIAAPPRRRVVVLEPQTSQADLLAELRSCEAGG